MSWPGQLMTTTTNQYSVAMLLLLSCNAHAADKEQWFYAEGWRYKLECPAALWTAAAAILGFVATLIGLWPNSN